MRTEAEVAAMSCPVCRVPLAMSDRQGIEIDYCPQCRGVWLDRGELDKILVRERRLQGADDDDFLREVEGRRRAPEPHEARRPDDRWDERRPDDRGYDDRKRRRRRSFLEDLLDFD